MNISVHKENDRESKITFSRSNVKIEYNENFSNSNARITTRQQLKEEDQGSFTNQMIGKRQDYPYSGIKIQDFDLFGNEKTQVPTTKPSTTKQQVKPKKVTSSQKQRLRQTSRSKRGHYRRYDEIVKKRAIELSNQLNDPLVAARKLDIPYKNLKRWLESGPIRKKGNRLFIQEEEKLKTLTWSRTYRVGSSAIETPTEKCQALKRSN